MGFISPSTTNTSSNCNGGTVYVNSTEPNSDGDPDPDPEQDPDPNDPGNEDGTGGDNGHIPPPKP